MDLASRFRTGVAWAVLGNLGNNFVSFIVFAIVARYVEPQDIGVVAIAVVFMEMGRVFSNAGVPDLIVRQKVWEDGYAMMCFWLNMAGAVIAAAVVVLLVAPVVAEQFAPGITSILNVLALCFIIDSFRVVPESKLRRSLDYKSLAQRGVSANLIAGLVAIVLALQGWGVWALVVQRLAGSLLTTLFTLVAARWVPSGKGTFVDVVPTLGHAVGLVGAGMMKLLSDRLPDLLFAVFLGPIAVGIFKVGARGYEALVQSTIVPMRSVSLSGYAASSRVGSMEKSLLRSLASASLVLCPMFFGAAAISSEFVQIAFGPRWGQSSAIMAILCLAGPSMLLSSLLQAAMSAKKKTQVIFNLSATNTITTLIVLVVCAPTIGLVGTTIALTVRSYLGMAYNVAVVAPTVGVRVSEIVKAVLPPLAGSVALLAAVLGMQHYMTMAPLQQLLTSLVLGAAVYFLMMLLFFRGHTLTTLGLRRVGG